MKKRIYILIGILLIIFLFCFLWWKQTVLPPNSTNKEYITFTIKRGEDTRSIADRLAKEGLIRSPLSFFLLFRIGAVEENIQAGNFRLNPSMDLYTVANSLSHGSVDIWVTIPEGWRKEEIALKIAQELSIPESEFNKVAQEGYMFPDTYLVPADASSSGVVKIFMDNFNKKVNLGIREKAAKNGLSLDKLINIASLVEREAKLPEDRPLVASVILNRLRIGMKLDIDATIQYALGYQSDRKSWWKKDLTIEDLEIDSPFNTYKNAGLPPGPISNPGLAAINSVIETPETDYIYYVADKNGKTHFAKSIEEHNTNISKYLNK